MNIPFDLVPPAIIFMVLAVGCTYYRFYEKRMWNKGICQKSGKSWKLFDNDSQGGRGYMDEDGNCIWISYSVDK
jgi:hypothetical protein